MESAPDLPLLNNPKLYRTGHPKRSPFSAVLNQFIDRFSREDELRFERSYGLLRSIVPKTVKGAEFGVDKGARSLLGLAHPPRL